jgi:hypothetical protein
MRFEFTAPMKKRITRKVVRMLNESGELFPELKDTSVTVGYTRTKAGVALIPLEAHVPLHIRLQVRGLSYNTIGHELTHLVQGVSRFPSVSGGVLREPLPGGEIQCDIWTLARGELFCDEAPVYIKLPGIVRDHWTDYAKAVRCLCIAAIQKRTTHRTYIRWLESQIRCLSTTGEPPPPEPRQLTLPLR